MGSISMTALNPQIEKWKVTLGMLKWGELIGDVYYTTKVQKSLGPFLVTTHFV
jgi:hypothetical protein